MWLVPQATVLHSFQRSFLRQHQVSARLRHLLAPPSGTGSTTATAPMSAIAIRRGGRPLVSTHFKEVLGFNGANKRVYEGLRLEVKIYMGVHDITDATLVGGEDWRALVDWVLAHQYMSRARRLHQDTGSTGTIELRRAVHFLCVNCLKSVLTSQRAVAVEQMLENSGYDQSPSPPTTAPTSTVASRAAVTSTALTTAAITATAPATPLVPSAAAPLASPGPAITPLVPRAIRVSLCDPDQFPDGGVVPSLGNGILKHYYAILMAPSYDQLALACEKYLPSGRVLREIRGATGAPAEDATLSDHEEVEGWLLDTRDIQPAQVLAILRERPRLRPVVVGIQPSLFRRMA